MTDGTVLVTGAGGFVCSEIVLALVRAGRDVVATDRAFDAATRARLAGVSLIEAPLARALADVGQVGAVIHGAALTADPGEMGITAAEHLNRNLGMLTRTLATARDAGAGRVLFLSSMGVFRPDDGPARAGRFTEGTVPTGAIPYAAAKRAGEIVTAAAADGAMQTLSLRLGNVAGPHEAVRDSRRHLCLIGRMLAQARTTGRIDVSDPEGAREWAWLPDLADGIAALMGAAWDAPVLHAGTPPILSHRALADAIAARMPGVTVAVTDGVSNGAGRIRAPMGSDHDSPMAAIRWTPTDAFLDTLIAARVTA